MNKLTIKIFCIFIMIMYCLAPLSAIDLNQESNTQLENVTDNENDTEIDIPNETSIDTADEERQDKDIDKTGNAYNDTIKEEDSEIKIKNVNETIANNENSEKRTLPLLMSFDHCNYGEKPIVYITLNDHECYLPYLNGDQIIISCPEFAHEYSISPWYYNRYYALELNENLEPGRYNVKIYHPEGSFYGYTSYTATLTIRSHVDPKLDVHVDDGVSGEKVNVTIKANESLNGHVGVQITDGYGDNVHVYGFDVVNGFAQGSIKALAPGNYTAKAIYKGDIIFAGSQKTTTFTVKENPNPKTRPYLSVHVDNIRVDEEANVQIKANESLNGDVKVKIIGINETRNTTVKVEKGVGQTSFNNLTPGYHAAIVSYDGDEKFKEVANSSSFYVKDIGELDWNIDIVGNTKEDKTEIKIQATDHIDKPVNPDKPVNIKLNNSQEYTLKLENGTGTLTIDDLAPGEYKAIVSYEGDSYYKPVKKTIGFIKKDKANLTIDAEQGIYPNFPTAMISINANKKLNGDVIVKMEDAHGYYVTKNVSVVNGNGYTVITELRLDKLRPGTYKITASYDGDDYISPETTSTSFIMYGSEHIGWSIDIVGNTKEDKTEIKIQATDYLDRPVTLDKPINIKLNNSQEYTLKLENGSGTLTIDDLAPGEYQATVSYEGDNYYKPQETIQSFIKKEKADLAINADTTGNDGRTISIRINANKKLNDDVIVKIEDAHGYYMERYISVVNGASRTCFIDGFFSGFDDGFEPGTYKITASYDGNDYISPETTSCTLIIK